MKKNKIIWLFLLAGLLFVLTIPVQAAERPADIKGHWAAVEINAATSEGWAYLENDKFSPDKSATREEVIWMLIGACDLVQVNGFDANKKAHMTAFKDEPSSWSKERMAIAIGNAYIQGYPDKTIKAQSKITRAEFAVMLSRLIEDGTTEIGLPFSDKIPNWSMEGIKKVYGKSIIKGYEDHTFKPSSNLTKAEALVMIKRWKDGLPKPICDEFKKILLLEKNMSVSADYTKITYYGQGEQASPNNQESQNGNGKYYIYSVINNFYVAINDYNQETLDSLNDSLKILIPSDADKVCEVVKSIADYQIKSVEEDGKKEESFAKDGKRINKEESFERDGKTINVEEKAYKFIVISIMDSSTNSK